MAKSIPVGTSVILSAYGENIEDNWLFKRYAIRGTVIDINPRTGEHTVKWEMPSHPAYKVVPNVHCRRHLKIVKG